MKERASNNPYLVQSTRSLTALVVVIERDDKAFNPVATRLILEAARSRAAVKR